MDKEFKAEYLCEVIPPLKCPFGCKTNQVDKKKNGIITCWECRQSFDPKKNKVEKLDKERSGKGQNPRYFTGDFLE